MKKFFLGAVLVSCLSIPACQCSDKPEVGPVDGTTAAVAPIQMAATA